MRSLINMTVITLIAGLSAWPATAEQSTETQPQSNTSPPPPCSSDQNFRAFDFWIGTWEVTPWTGGAIQGHNIIAPAEGGCMLTERWTNTAGGTGRSINYFNPNTGKWRQIWIAGGYSIDIEGGLKNGAMALEGMIHYYAQKNSVPFKGTWTPQTDGSVRQFFEQYNPEKKEWATWFDGRYVSYTPQEE